MPQQKYLYEAIEDILNKIIELLQAETASGGMLEGVTKIVRSDRARPRPDTPSVWVFAERATAVHPPMSLAEKWELPIILSAICKSDEPDTGYMEANKLAAKARSVLLKDRTLGLRDFVQDVRSANFDPSGPHFNEGQLYGAAATVNIIFTILEK